MGRCPLIFKKGRKTLDKTDTKQYNCKVVRHAGVAE